jgi:hypothetical protein
MRKYEYSSPAHYILILKIRMRVSGRALNPKSSSSGLELEIFAGKLRGKLKLDWRYVDLYIRQEACIIASCLGSYQGGFE